MHIPFLSKAKTPPAPCSHRTREGNACHATPQAGKPYCFFHDPERAQERTAARRQGGLTSIGKAAPVVPPSLPLLSLKTPADVRRLYEDTINYVLQGQMDLRTANTIRSLLSGLLRTLLAIERSQREAAKATTLPGKGKFPPYTRPVNSAPFASTHELETGNWQLATASQTLPGKDAPSNADEPGMPESPGVPHSRPSASGNEDHDAMTKAKSDFALVKTFDEQRRLSLAAQNGSDFKAENKEAMNTEKKKDKLMEPPKVIHNSSGGIDILSPTGAPEPPPPQPPVVIPYDELPSPIPGLKNKHLNYMKYEGMKLPPSQRPPIRIPREFVSGGMCAKRIEFFLNADRLRRG